MQGLSTKPVNLDDIGFEEQFDRLCKAIESAFNRPVRVGLQSLDKPLKAGTDETDYPFYGWNIVSGRQVQNAPYEEADEEKITRKSAESWEWTILFGCISDDMYTSMDGAQRLHNWFNDTGKYTLKSIGQAFVSIGSVTQRDAFLQVNYERRYGFEVTIRMGRVVTTEIVYIEKANIEGSYIGVKEE